MVSGERAQAAAGVWIQAHLQALQAEMLQLPGKALSSEHSVWEQAEQGPPSAQSTALLPLPNGSIGLLENSSDCLLLWAIFVTSCIL